MVPVSVIIPTLNAAARLGACLSAVASATEIVVVDGGSSDDTVAIARAAGVTCIAAPTGRGPQLIAGANAAGHDWLLFLHADTQLETAWADEVMAFIADPANLARAAAFTFALDDDAVAARWLETGVRWRALWIGFPYGDQGLLIHRQLYDEVRGYRPLPIMEDVDIARRIGRRRIIVLKSRAITSANRWRQEGWVRRSARNLLCIACYHAGVAPHHIKRLYGR